MELDLKDMDDFYFKGVDIEDVKKILSPEMHYHLTGKKYNNRNTPINQTVIDLYSYIGKGSTVLDCGSGWGGPAKMLKDNLGCEVTGVTSSSNQANYTRQFMKTVHSDLHEFRPTEKYDVALFIESYNHFKNANIVLNNIKDSVDKVIIKDFISEPAHIQKEWNAIILSRELYTKQLDKAGFIIDEFIVTEIGQYSQRLWADNIKLLDENFLEIHPHIKLLYNFCIDTLKNGFGGTKHCTIVAHKRK
jgi:hypothetical protein